MELESLALRALSQGEIQAEGIGWILFEDNENGGRLVLMVDKQKYITVGLYDNGLPEDKERVEIMEYIKQSFALLKGVK